MKSRAAAPKASAAASKKKAPGEVRLIGGRWKRSKLPVPDQPGLRPTPDRVRETLFNWLGQDLRDWRCLDAFAGTGALGFEAASRGATSVLMLERDPNLVDKLIQTRQRLAADMVTVRRADAVTAMGALPAASFELILLDPPFDSNLAEPALRLSAKLVSPGGFIYLEASSPCSEESLSQRGLRLFRHLKAGAVHAHLLRPAFAA